MMPTPTSSRSFAMFAAICRALSQTAGDGVTLQGTATQLKETTSSRGNDYTTFKLQGPGGMRCGQYLYLGASHIE
jgi:hypothetical protein